MHLPIAMDIAKIKDTHKLTSCSIAKTHLLFATIQGAFYPRSFVDIPIILTN